MDATDQGLPNPVTEAVRSKGAAVSLSFQVQEERDIPEMGIREKPSSPMIGIAVVL
ncbi:MAG: hypothetical protein R3C68_08920 [Myxococcota bacterium]